MDCSMGGWVQSLGLSKALAGSGFYTAIYVLRLKFALCAHPFCPKLLKYGSMHLGLVLNLLHFFPDLGALYALGGAPNFYEIHPGLVIFTGN
jgi:hypothetical protein